MDIRSVTTKYNAQWTLLVLVEFVVDDTTKVPKYGTIIEITGNEAVLKNIFGFGIQVFG